MPVRYFLVAPKDATGAAVTDCAKAACAAGDCASIIVHDGITAETIAALQQCGLAVLLGDMEPRQVAHLKADGLHLSSPDADVKAARESLPKSAMLGVDCGTSRHAAMEAAEQGADYVAFRQRAQTQGEPLVKWWNDLAEIPAVPFDPASAADATILAQQSDFLRPSDAMWQSPEAATRIIAELNDRLK